jgi:hypothetical protein
MLPSPCSIHKIPKVVIMVRIRSSSERHKELFENCNRETFWNAVICKIEMKAGHNIEPNRRTICCECET